MPDSLSPWLVDASPLASVVVDAALLELVADDVLESADGVGVDEQADVTTNATSARWMRPKVAPRLDPQAAGRHDGPMAGMLPILARRLQCMGVLLGVAAAAPACAAGVVVPSADPHPTLHLAKHSESIGLRIEFAVADEVEHGREPGVPAVKILGFHTTLQNGFENAFKPFFAELGGVRSDIVIEISRADPHFLPDEGAVLGEGAAVRAIVEYEARMIANRRVIGTTRGRATSTRTTERLDQDGAVVVGEAVADMYEQVVADLFAQYAATYKRALGE